MGQGRAQAGDIDALAAAEEKTMGRDVVPWRQPVHERAGGGDQDAARQGRKPVEGFEAFGNDALVRRHDVVGQALPVGEMQDGQGGRCAAAGRFRHPASRAVQGRTSIARSRRLRATGTGTSLCGVEPDFILEPFGGMHAGRDDEQGAGVFAGRRYQREPAGASIEPAPTQQLTGLFWQNWLKW